MRMPWVLLAGACLVGGLVVAQERDDAGKPAPDLVAAGWDGTPVSLTAVKGNCVLLAFWNSKGSC